MLVVVGMGSISRMLVTAAAAFLVFAAPAKAGQVIVVDGNHAKRVNDPTVPSKASIVLPPARGAVLAGVLGGMGLVSLASWAEVVLWERRAGVTLFADADVHTRRYVVPAQPPEARPEPEPSASTAPHAPGGSRGK